ncbi:hypothetical protein FBR02_08180 [Anaerolineae bacterium CFX9]|jgi:TolB protein|nr:hypothetical protein [Anaerolineae bacterium CFX9]
MPDYNRRMRRQNAPDGQNLPIRAYNSQQNKITASGWVRVFKHLLRLFAALLCLNIVSAGVMLAAGGLSAGEVLAFQRRGERDYSRIYLYDLTHRRQTPLTPPDVSAFSPAWSPDGAYLAYLSRDNPLIVEDTIMTIGWTGRGITPLRDIFTLAVSSPALAWSPDGRQLAFTEVYPVGRFQSVFVMDLDGGGLRRVSGDNGNAFAPTWSPDGSRIAYSWSPVANAEIWEQEIGSLLLTGQTGAPTRLTSDYRMDSHPAYSPDGSRIAFMSGRDNNSEIYLMNRDGSGLFNVTQHPALDSMPSWSSDGRWLAFTSNRDQGFDIYIIRADGSDLIRLTEGSATADYNPVWRPR